MSIDTTYFERCIQTLEKAHSLLNAESSTTIEYDMYRSACIKEFEIILEQSGKLLRKILKHYMHSSKEVDKLYFKDLFRIATLHCLITDETCMRWLKYRDNRNNTAHDYGVNFAEETLVLLPAFIDDAFNLAEIIKQHEPVSEE